MTQDELDALPEDGTFSYTEEIRNGLPVRVPHYHTVGALYQPGGEPSSVIDSHGVAWILGYVKGVRYKRRMR